MLEVRVPIPGAVTIEDRNWLGGPDGHVVGGDGLWNDDSDATYAELYVTDNSVASFADGASGALAATPIDADPSRVQIALALRCQAITSTGAERPMTARLLTIFDAFVGEANNDQIPSSTPQTIVLPLTIDESHSAESVLNFINSGALVATVNMEATLEVDSTVYPGVRVFETYLLVTVLSRIVSARRKYPRSDGRGRGPRRIYPTPSTRVRGRHGPESSI